MPLQLRLDAAPDSGAAARRAVRSWLVDHGLDVRADDVTLLTSELVTNALRHGAGPLDLTLTRLGDRLRLVVHDHGPALPQPREAALDDTGGRGLALVAALALRWGVEADDATPDGAPRGKAVWVEVALSPAR